MTLPKHSMALRVFLSFLKFTSIRSVQTWTGNAAWWSTCKTASHHCTENVAGVHYWQMKWDTKRYTKVCVYTHKYTQKYNLRIHKLLSMTKTRQISNLFLSLSKQFCTSWNSSLPWNRYWIFQNWLGPYSLLRCPDLLQHSQLYLSLMTCPFQGFLAEPIWITPKRRKQ